MLRRALTLGIGIACGASVAIAREAHACTVCDPQGGVALVGDAESQPANVGFFVWDVADPEGHVEVWVDGVPAAVERIDGPELQLGSPGILARVVPTPATGAMVYVLGHPSEICFGEDLPDEQGYVAGPLDVEAPYNLVEPYWDLHEFDYQEHLGCSGEFDGFIHVRGGVPAEDPQQAARILEVEIQSGPQDTIARAFVIDPDDPDFAVRVEGDDFAGHPLDELCVRVTVSDATGLRSEPGEWICRPCHHVVSPPSVDTIPDEPAWSDDDLVPDGFCGLGAPPPPDDGESTGAAESTGGGVDTSAGDVDTGTDAEEGPPPPVTTTTSDPTDADDTSGAPAIDDGAVDRGCACTASGAEAIPWLIVLPLLSRRRGRSSRRRR